MESIIYDILNSGSDAVLALIFLLMLIFGEFVVFMAFILSQQGILNQKIVILISFIALFAIDLFWFFIGKLLSRSRFGFRYRDKISAVNLFQSKGDMSLLFNFIFFKFLIGLRIVFILFISFKDMIKFKKFLLYNFFAMFIYIGFLSMIGIFLGKFINNLDVSYSYKLMSGTLFCLGIIYIMKNLSFHFKHKLNRDS